MTVSIKLKTRSQKGFILALHDVEHALFLVAADHSADRRFRLVALLVAYEGAAVEQLTPVPLFGGVGDRGAERFPDFVPWNAGIREAVVFGVGVGPFDFAVGAKASDVRCCEVFGDVADVEVGEACDAIVGSMGGPSIRAREGLGECSSEAYVDGFWLGVVFVVLGGYGSPDGCLCDRGARDDVGVDGVARVVGGVACVEPEFVVGIVSVDVCFEEDVIRISGAF